MLGGEVVRRLQMDSSLRRRPIQRVVLDLQHDMKCCDSNFRNISTLAVISHFVPTFKLRQMLVLRHEK